MKETFDGLKKKNLRNQESYMSTEPEKVYKQNEQTS